MSSLWHHDWSASGVDHADVFAKAVQDHGPTGDQEAETVPWAQQWLSPGPVADRFYWDDADVCLLRGPVGSGKTTANLRKPFRRAIGALRSTRDGVRRYKVVIARATYRQLWQTTIPSWFEIMPRSEGQWSGGRGDPVTHRITFSDQHGDIEFIAEFLAFGETASEIQANVRGVQTTDFLLEEADTVDPILFTTAIGRIDRYPSKSHFRGGEYCEAAYPLAQQSYGQINATYNAPEEGNWILPLEGDVDPDNQDDAKLAEIVREAGITINFYRQPGAFEPGAENMENLGTQYYPRQIAIMKAAGSGHDVDRLVHNKIGYLRTGDPVFEKEFNPRVHVADTELEPWRDRPLLIGLDQGFFGAAVLAQFRRPYQWRFYAELWSKERKSARAFGRDLRDLLSSPRFAGMSVGGAFGDMAGEQGNAAGADNETWNAVVSSIARITIDPQMIGSNRIEPRLNVWRAAMEQFEMGEPGLLICPSMKLTIRGLAAKYVWAEELDKAGNRTTKPKKRGVREADVIDAAGYVMLSEALPDGTVDTGGDEPEASGAVYHDEPQQPWSPTDGI